MLADYTNGSSFFQANREICLRVTMGRQRRRRRTSLASRRAAFVEASLVALCATCLCIAVLCRASPTDRRKGVSNANGVTINSVQGYKVAPAIAVKTPAYSHEGQWNASSFLGVRRPLPHVRQVVASGDFPLDEDHKHRKRRLLEEQPLTNHDQSPTAETGDVLKAKERILGRSNAVNQNPVRTVSNYAIMNEYINTTHTCPPTSFATHPPYEFPDIIHDADAYTRPLPDWIFKYRTPPPGKVFAKEPRSYNRQLSRANCCGPLLLNDTIWSVCDHFYWYFHGTEIDETKPIKTLGRVPNSFNSNFHCVYSLVWLHCGDAFEDAVCCNSYTPRSDGRVGSTWVPYCDVYQPRVPCFADSGSNNVSSSSTTSTSTTTTSTTTSTAATTNTTTTKYTTTTESYTTTTVFAWQIGGHERVVSGSIALGGGLLGSIVYVLSGHTATHSGNIFVQAALKHPLQEVSPNRHLPNPKEVNDVVPNRVDGASPNHNDDINDAVSNAADVIENLEEALEDDEEDVVQALIGNSSFEVWEALDGW